MPAVLKGIFYGAVLTVSLAVAAGALVLKMGYLTIQSAKEVAEAAAKVAALSATKRALTKDLTHSRGINSKLRERNHLKLKKALPKLMKNGVKKGGAIVASSLGGALTVGLTTALVGTLLADDHCENLKDIHEMDQLLDDAEKKFDYKMCFNETIKVVNRVFKH